MLVLIHLVLGPVTGAASLDATGLDWRDFLAWRLGVERELIARAMRKAKGNKSRAAKMLGLTRPRLYRRLVQLGLEPATEKKPPRPEAE